MKNNIYLKYPGTWVLYALAIVSLITHLPLTISVTLAFFSGFMPLWSVLNAWAYVLAILISVSAGVYWIVRKEGSNLSLIVGFMISLGSYFILLSLLGYLNTSLILGL